MIVLAIKICMMFSNVLGNITECADLETRYIKAHLSPCEKCCKSCVDGWGMSLLNQPGFKGHQFSVDGSKNYNHFIPHETVQPVS